jgi:sterol desaturase/sphingolipid hydroxylase (fatty acid hydroxylase superfamily)
MEYEPLIRLIFFFGVLLSMAVWEAIAPRRPLSVGKGWRWLSNLGMMVVNTIAVRVVFALGVVCVAVVAQERGWGGFNNVPFPSWLAVLLSVLALDFIIYLQHVLFHAVPLFWRLHMVHHADLDFDVTTGLRFHTVELLLSMGIKVAAVVLLGAPAVAVLIFEVLLNATSMFNHSNVQMPLWVDRIVRLFVVTPDMHRVHHSVVPNETNSNFGFNIPWWDFLFGTYRGQPSAGHREMTIGLSQFRGEWVDRLHWMLAMPFIWRPADYPINRRSPDRENRSNSAAHAPGTDEPPAGGGALSE